MASWAESLFPKPDENARIYVVAPHGTCPYETATFFRRMRIAGHPHLLFAAISILSIAFGHVALAQGGGQKPPPMRKATDFLRRQEPAKINKGLEGSINSDNSHVVVSISKQRVYLMTGDQVYIDSPISSGKRGHETPTGSFHVQEKDPDHHSSVYGNFVDRGGRIVRSGISSVIDSAPSGTRFAGRP